LKIGLVAGEASGDLLGAGLIRAIRERVPAARFGGVAGPAMIEAGCEAWAPAERLSVMGLAEVLKVLPGLLRLRRGLARRMLEWQPDVFVGIDAPDFTLGLEKRLRSRGLRTVHYVSPSIWAWRAGRIRKIGRAADLVLCLLPFEPLLYENSGIGATFVGHPMADRIPERSDRAAARRSLGLQSDGGLVAVLPGSRGSELKYLASDFAGAIAWLAARREGLRFVGAMARPDLRLQFESALAERAPGVDVTLLDGQAEEAMAAADVVLLASGTATLQAALIKRPMVVAYRVAGLTRWVFETFGLIKLKRFALPNLLAGRDLVPEILQDEITPARLGEAVLSWLDDPSSCDGLTGEFDEIHTKLRRGADARAAEAILGLDKGETRL
jgi:lipid-A-disaccharide synthase